MSSKPENHLTIPISGTGSAAKEAAVANFVEPGTPVLICINGYFGNRLLDMTSEVWRRCCCHIPPMG